MNPEKLYLFIVLSLVPVPGFISIILNYQIVAFTQRSKKKNCIAEELYVTQWY